MSSAAQTSQPGRPAARTILFGCALLACAAAGCESKNEPPAESAIESSGKDAPGLWPSDQRRADVYVGSSRCTECHADIANSYLETHPMAKSVRFPDEFSRAAMTSLPNEFTAGGKQYRVFDVDGRLTQAERMLDKEGVVYEQVCGVDFAIGSGTRGYSFVTGNHGTLYQAPVTWYSQKEKWDLSPGYAPLDHPRFERRMSDACIFCHAGNANREPTATNQFKDPVFHEAIIGCERCHGAGADHVSLHNGAKDGIVDPIVNPARLDAERRDSVCYQCHLHGRGRILRQSRSDYDFRPGDLLSDVWVTFVDEPAEAEASESFKAVSQVEQMLASRCFQESEGRLGCISCHDPHRKPNESARIGFYRNRCVQCHETDDACGMPVADRIKESPNDSCIQCHMPAAGASDIPHTAQTDHRVLRRYLNTTVEGNRGQDVFRKTQQPIPENAIRRAYGLKLSQNVQTRSQAAEAMDLLTPFVDKAGQDEAVLSAASWLLLYLGDLPAARMMGERALKLRPSNDSTIEALVITERTAGRLDESLSYAELLIKLVPFNSTFHARKAQVLMDLNRFDDAAEACREALAVNPVMHAARELLIEALKKADKPTAAAEQQKLLDRMKAVQKAERR